jgi:AraC-like DNA-binding protein
MRGGRMSLRLKESARRCFRTSPEDKVYQVAKLARFVDALTVEGISAKSVLAGVHIAKNATSSPDVRVSVNQIVDFYHNANKLCNNPHFAYGAGLRFHVTDYGMYGFAILSSTNYRSTMQFAVKYHQLAAPLAEIDFQEADGCGIWTFTPMAHPRIDASLYRFLVEMHFGIIVSLHRDLMGPSFAGREVHVTYGAPDDASDYSALFGCPVLFNQSANQLRFAAGWLDLTPKLGNEITYVTVVELCDRLIDDLQLRAGLAGQVRQLLLTNLLQPLSFSSVASNLNMSVRTLRRRLREEKTSFRNLVDELRMEMAIRYLRETNLTVGQISESLGFSDVATFRQAFRRWTKAAPHKFRSMSGEATISAHGS